MKNSTDSRFRAIFIATFLLFWTLPSWAMELVMVEQEICPFCKLFDEEVGGEYSSTEAGKRAPLRRVNLKEAWPEDLKDIKHNQLTPVFILINDNKEMGRFRGYAGRDEFWALLQQLLDEADGH